MGLMITEKNGKMMMQKVDFHIHSLYSDGVYRIPEIIRILKREEIMAFSITDHDTIDGVREAAEAEKDSLKYIPGIEFTCREQKFCESGRKFSIHLLGYGFDAGSMKLQERLDRRKRDAAGVFDRLCREICQMGCDVRREDIPISCGIVMQLCDVEAYVRILYPEAEEPVYRKISEYSSELDRANISVQEAMDLIHGAGGKTVWAHPFYTYEKFHKIRISGDEILAALPPMKEMGLDGIEADYLSFSEEEREWLRGNAQREGLITTAGSDFHGSPGRSRMGVIKKGELKENEDKQNYKRRSTGIIKNFQ